jgi:hypothetical protein
MEDKDYEHDYNVEISNVPHEYTLEMMKDFLTNHIGPVAGIKEKSP